MMPCERAHWKVLPAIRREFARVFVLEMRKTQAETARILEITEAAVSHYISDKRGNAGTLDKKTKAYIRRLAKGKALGTEKIICSACRYALREK